jgi:hypothetical protein
MHFPQASMGHALNRQTTDGMVKQSEADNMCSFSNLVLSRGMSHKNALLVMGVQASLSTASMWIQAYGVVACNWQEFTQDQERHKPLVSCRFYTRKWMKCMQVEMRVLFLREVITITFSFHCLLVS